MFLHFYGEGAELRASNGFCFSCIFMYFLKFQAAGSPPKWLAISKSLRKEQCRSQNPKGGRSQEPRQKHKWRQVATNRWHEFFTHHYFLWSFAFTARLIGFKGAVEVELLNAQWKHPETLQSSFCSDKLSCCDCCSRPCWRLPESKPLMNFVMVTFIVWRPPWSAPCP